MELLLHDKTKIDIDQFMVAPSHALLLVARPGMGKSFVAHNIAASIINTSLDNLEKYPFLLTLKPDEKSTISVDQIRSIKGFLNLKTTGKNQIRRIVIIEDAQHMTPEAQNSILKTLEEPPKDTLIILTATNSRLLLPTITSRVNLIEIRLPGKKLLSLFAEDFSENEVNKAYIISGGRPGLMYALLSNQDTPLLKYVSLAKNILGLKAYQRLLMVNELSSKENNILGIIEGLYVVAHASLKQQIQNENWVSAKRMQHICALLKNAESNLDTKPSTKLLLTDLLLQL